MEFHVSRAARERYDFDEGLFSLTGNVVFPDFGASRRFAQRMNVKRAAEIAADPNRSARAGDLNAMGLIDEVLHSVIDLYRQQRDPQLMSAALAKLEGELGLEQVEATLRTFAEHFPTVAAYRGDLSAVEYLAGQTNGRANREIALEELLLNWLANENPARGRYDELFDDGPIAERTAYTDLVDSLADYFAGQPGFGPADEDLVSLLRKPALEAPGSLAEQIQWLRQRWGFALGRLGDRLAIGLNVLKEDDQADWMRFHPPLGGGAESAVADAAALHGFDDLPAEEERFSADLDWMPRLVLLAKSTYVWLDQLSKAYGRDISRLDQIPDEELDRLAGWGVSGLWLIGLWERSAASQKIKQLRGQPDAVASAYSLYDYAIAADLGGEGAYNNLRERAWARGVRLASDMVPNHMGIDSRWVVQHPDWFISRPDAPFPVYSFNGPDLSSDELVGIHLEDHYYDNSDAAVTFKRVDRRTGEERYVYHGNDGTSYAWNDTAQLDYTRADVREAVIQTILHVARLFPVIRFDAAMVLAKKHIQRLWHPEPGEGGAIPSRAESSMSRREFNKLMPEEFWREVVDRVAAEAPDTLLLAEAFWLMEGYFVRTLGMHRVYNSAFMNMMRDEKNAEYRLVIKNTLEFDPQILKRYVNFMNNPDEKTAVEQFGDGDKYFGVATLMATMPGLPMFGHGQIEGFSEKYGMEYRRARLDEPINEGLIRRHEEQIFPLLHRRELFAEVTDFAFYDFETTDGSVNEDVYAYSNSWHGQRTLVVYHNRFGSTAGWIRQAAVSGRSLADGLAAARDQARFLVLRDWRGGLEYLRLWSAIAKDGLYLELGAYRCFVFAEIRDVVDTDDRWSRLADWLDGRGVPSLEVAMREMDLAPLHQATRDLWAARSAPDLNRAAKGLNNAVGHLAGRNAKPIEPRRLGRALYGDASPSIFGWRGGDITERDAEEHVVAERTWRFAKVIDAAVATCPDLLHGRWLDAWRMKPVLAEVMQRMNLGPMSFGYEQQMPEILSVLLSRDGRRLDPEAFEDPAVRRAIGVNEHDGLTWFSEELFQRFVDWLQVPELERVADGRRGVPAGSSAAFADAELLDEAARRAGYRLDRLADELRNDTPRQSRAPRTPRPSFARKRDRGGE